MCPLQLKYIADSLSFVQSSRHQRSRLNEGKHGTWPWISMSFLFIGRLGCKLIVNLFWLVSRFHWTNLLLCLMLWNVDSYKDIFVVQGCIIEARIWPRSLWPSTVLFYFAIEIQTAAVQSSHLASCSFLSASKSSSHFVFKLTTQKSPYICGYVILTGWDTFALQRNVYSLPQLKIIYRVLPLSSLSAHRFL